MEELWVVYVFKCRNEYSWNRFKWLCSKRSPLIMRCFWKFSIVIFTSIKRSWSPATESHRPVLSFTSHKRSLFQTELSQIWLRIISKLNIEVSSIHCRFSLFLVLLGQSGVFFIVSDLFSVEAVFSSQPVILPFYVSDRFDCSSETSPVTFGWQT